MRIVVLAVLTLMGACNGSHSFTGEEELLIGRQGDGIMRVLTVGAHKDSLFLRQHAADWTEAAVKSDLFRVLKQRLLLTVNDTANPGVGIAAPQVGIGRRMIAVQRFDKQDTPFEFYVNPYIIYYSDERSTGAEGCLSIPGRADSVSRSQTIVVKYNDEYTWEEKQDSVKGFTAVIFQHETDHLEGILYTDRVNQ